MSATATAWPLEVMDRPAPLGERVRHAFDAAAEPHRVKARRLTRVAQALLGVIALCSLLGALSGSWLVLTLVAGLAIAWFIVLATKASALDALDEQAPATAMVDRLLQDFAPTQRLSVMIDMRDPAEARAPFRKAQSPYSGATKAHHRNKCLAVKGITVDGCVLGFEVTRRVKLKSGSVIRDLVQLKGRVVLGPGRDTRGLKRPGGLKVRETRPGHELAFGGEFKSLDDAIGTVAALMSATRTTRKA